PPLTRLRKLVHEGCPGVVETIKWGSPSFEYHGILFGMAAFKQHCAFGFWTRALNIPDADPGAAMGQFGRLESEADMLSDKVLLGYIREAARLNETGQKLGPMERTKRKPPPGPKELAA